jgi:hypothetical protein
MSITQTIKAGIWGVQRRLDEVRILRHAKTNFDAMTLNQDERTGGPFYQQHPKLRLEHWAMIEKEIREICSAENRKTRNDLFRAKRAKVAELFASARRYAYFTDEERDLFCRHVLNSSREVQDAVYFSSLWFDFTYGCVLMRVCADLLGVSAEEEKGIGILHGWFIEACDDHLDFVMTIARARSEGRETTEREKDKGRTAVFMKELMRRGLAGEVLFDDDRRRLDEWKLARGSRSSS